MPPAMSAGPADHVNQEPKQSDHRFSTDGPDLCPNRALLVARTCGSSAFATAPEHRWRRPVFLVRGVILFDVPRQYRDITRRRRLAVAV